MTGLNRALYPENVDVSPSTLTYDSQAIRAAHLGAVEAAVSGNVGGRLGGGDVTLVSGTTLAVSAMPYGLTPGGYPLTFNGTAGVNVATQSGVDLTDGAVNYVVLTYTETATDTRVAVSTSLPGTSIEAPTRAVGVTTLRVYSAANLAALPNPTAAQDTDLSIVSLRRCLVLARFLGNGFTSTTPNALVPGEISQTGVTGLRTADTPSGSVLRIAEAPNALVQNIHGVVIVGLASTCPVGTGTLVWNGSTRRLTWAAPDGTGGTESAGASVLVNDSSGGPVFVTLQSTTTSPSRAITLYAYPAILFATTGTVSDSIAVLDLHGDDIGAYLSAQDRAHRRLRGSAMPSRQNPHAMGVENMGGVAFVPQAEQAGDALLGSADLGAIPRRTHRAAVDSGSIAWTHIDQDETRLPVSGVTAAEFVHRWAHAFGESQIIGARRNPATGQWTLENSSGRAWRIVTGNNSSTPDVDYPQGFEVQTQASASPWNDDEWRRVFRVSPTGQLVSIGEGFSDGSSVTDLSLARLFMGHPHNSADTKTLVVDSPDSSGGSGSALGMQILRGTDDPGTPSPRVSSTFEIVHNATYNNASLSTPWAYRDSSQAAIRYLFGQTTCTVQRRAAGLSTPWASGDWSSLVSVDLTTGLINAVPGGIASSSYRLPGVEQVKSIPPTRVEYHLEGTTLIAPASSIVGTGGASATNGVLAAGMPFPLLPGHGTGASMGWSLELPQGAVISRLVFHASNTAGGWSGNLIGLYRKDHLSNTWSALANDQPTTFSTNATAGNYTYTFNFTGPTDNIVANQSYSYYVRLFNGASASGNSFSVTGIEVYYTFGGTVGIRGA